MNDFEIIKLTNELKIANMINSYNSDNLFFNADEEEILEKAIKIHVLNSAKEILMNNKLNNEIRNMAK